MGGLTTDQALAIVGFARQAARALGAKPLGDAVVDTGGHLERAGDPGQYRSILAIGFGGFDESPEGREAPT